MYFIIVPAQIILNVSGVVRSIIKIDNLKQEVSRGSNYLSDSLVIAC